MKELGLGNSSEYNLATYFLESHKDAEFGNVIAERNLMITVPQRGRALS